MLQILMRKEADGRCQLPNVDVKTGIRDKDYPYKALVISFAKRAKGQSKYRRVDKGTPVNLLSEDGLMWFSIRRVSV
jgi:hypothetical protein